MEHDTIQKLIPNIVYIIYKCNIQLYTKAKTTNLLTVTFHYVPLAYSPTAGHVWFRKTSKITNFVTGCERIIKNIWSKNVLLNIIESNIMKYMDNLLEAYIIKFVYNVFMYHMIF